MGTKIICSVFLIVCSLLAGATDISFVVYFAKGDVRNAKKIKLKKGDNLTASESFTIGENASLVLVCSNYKVLQLNKKGNYNTKNMQDRCATNTAGYSSAYFKYVWEQFSHPHGKPEANPGDYMKNVGAVSRGCNEVSTGIPADTLIIGEGSFPLYWSSTYTKSILAIYDVAVDGAAIQKSILKDKVPINFDSITKSLPPGDYYWNITDEEGNGCERSFLRLLDSATYEQNVYMLIENIPNTTMAEIAFARSFILQQHFYIAPALASSKLAAELEPSNKLYKKNLAQFYATQF